MDKNSSRIPKDMSSLSSSAMAKLTRGLIEGINLNSTKEVVENNISHKHESVYDHTLEVVTKFENYLQLKFIKSSKLKKQVKSYFSEKIGNHTRAELFIISAYIHDIGKKDVIVTDEKGFTSAPRHELISAELSKKVLHKLKFNRESIEYVYNLIRLHSGFSLRFLDYLNSLTDGELKVAVKQSLLLPEILLYQIADNENAKIFKDYLNIINRLLQISELYEHEKAKQKSKLSLDEVVNRLRYKINLNSKPWSLEARMLHLSEEVGELHDIYLQVKGAKDREQTIEDIRIALNDVMMDIIALYDIYEINLTDALEKDLSKDE